MVAIKVTQDRYKYFVDLRVITSLRIYELQQKNQANPVECLAFNRNKPIILN